MTAVAKEPRATALDGLHRDLGARLVPFAGYLLPVQYPAGIVAEHQHTRSAASLFDVSHMGQVRLDGEARADALESLLPADIDGLAEGRVRYGFFTTETGGILDDLLVTNRGDYLYLVVNAARKAEDLELLRSGLDGQAQIRELDDLALLALQGPKAAEALDRLAPGAADMSFMTARSLTIDGVACQVSRSGYTGEDGYEISVQASAADQVARSLLLQEEVAPAGLGARDSLRLEAGLCLYGHDIDESTSPVEACLTWAIQKRRRQAGDFPGAEVISRQLQEGTGRLRVGLKPEGRAPVREGAELQNEAGNFVGQVTSGGFGPTVGGPLAMAYVRKDLTAEGTLVYARVRDRSLPCRVTALPFVKPNYHRG